VIPSISFPFPVRAAVSVRVAAALTYVVAVIAVTDSPATAQPVAISSVTCQTCRISIALLASLGASSGSGEVGELSTMTRMRDGQYVLSYNGADEELVVFSPTGDAARRLGRKGSGPGEFQFIRWTRAAGDNLHVFDAQLRRHTTFSGDLKVVRTAPFTFFLSGTPRWLTTRHTCSERPGQVACFLLHVVRPSGNLIASFAEDPDGYRFDVSEEVYSRSLERSSMGGIWAAHRTEYRIDHWRLDGTLQSSMIRQAPWFAAHEGSEGAPDPKRPPRPRLLDVNEDSAGRLWTLIRVASSDWVHALERLPADAHRKRSRFAIADINQAFDTIIEVFDYRRGRLLASVRFDQALIEFVDTNQAVSYEPVNDVPRLRIWRVSFHERGLRGSRLLECGRPSLRFDFCCSRGPAVRTPGFLHRHD
jgi:hypothetical protein